MAAGGFKKGERSDEIGLYRGSRRMNAAIDMRFSRKMDTASGF